MKALTEILWFGSIVIGIAMILSEPAKLSEHDLSRLSLGKNRGPRLPYSSRDLRSWTGQSNLMRTLWNSSE